MGLDAVELVMETEQAFGISLPDDNVSKVVTAGDLHDLVCRCLSATEHTSCLTAVAFYRVRKLLISVTGAARSEIRPKTDLQTLLPACQRKAVWRQMERSSNFRLPALSLPRWGIPASIALTALMITIGVFAIDWPVSLLLVLPGFVVLVLALWMVDLLFGTVLREEIRTVGGFAKGVLAKNHGVLATDVATHNRDEVWQSVRMLVAERLDVDIERVTKDASFVADLGMS